MLAFVFLSVFVVKSTQTKMASADVFSSGYAKVLTNDCYLLKEPDGKTGVFLLEQSYFVKVVDASNDVFFKVKYMEFDGYVLKSKVGFVEEFPKFPYLASITFDIYDLGNVCMRSSPFTKSDDSNILCTLNMSTKNVTYFGKCTGEEAIDGLGNVWYFAGYEDENGKLFKGYIYAPLTRNLSSIANSSENLTLVSIDNFLPVENLLYLNLSTKNMLIIITSLPTIFVIYLLTKTSKNKNIES